MAIDNVTFLIVWFLIMFITISTGILVIMYRVGCFKCPRKIGIADLQLVEKLKSHHNQQEQQEQVQEHDQQGHEANSKRPQKICPVCGEPLSPEDAADEDNTTHPSCRDMDASFL